MHKLIIEGGAVLNGTTTISGAKNSVLPILAGSILSSAPVVITNAPHLQDVTTMLELLGMLGAKISMNDNMEITIDPSSVNNFVAPYDLVRAMRASIVILGPLLTKYGYAKVSLPGGCAIGQRPIDLHIKGLKALGANIEVTAGYIIATAENGLIGADFTFDIVSVTGSENVIMAAVLAKGTTTLRNVAREPEVVDVCNFLVSMGAIISGIGTSTLVIKGVKELGATVYSVIPDRLEAGTYLVAAAITGGNITLKNTAANDMNIVLDKLKEAGALLEITQDTISLDMRDRELKAVDIVTAPYPGFPTDLQALFAALNAVAAGQGTITENLFENRFMHIQELSRMGAEFKVSGNKVLSIGNKKLVGAEVMATDLRASASLVVAGLAAVGTTIIDNIYHIDRGYECIEEKLAQLGARIYRSGTY